MAEQFEMSDLGKLTYYLGIEVIQGEEGITLKQERYAIRILDEAAMQDCNAVQIPMDFGLKLSKALDEEDVYERDYTRMIGCLRYLLHTQPDLFFCVGILSRYMHKPKRSNAAALKHILRYLKGTLRYGLVFKRTGKTELVGYSDNSHNIDEDDGRSNTGHVFYLDNCRLPYGVI